MTFALLRDGVAQPQAASLMGETPHDLGKHVGVKTKPAPFLEFEFSPDALRWSRPACR
jgi:hypothetical protein